MSQQHLLLDTPAVVASRLKTSITQISELRSEITALGLDQVRHRPTPLQNQLLAAACTALEAWIEIQKEKLAKAEALRVPPEAEVIRALPEGAQVIEVPKTVKRLIPNPNPGMFGPYFTPGLVPIDPA